MYRDRTRDTTTSVGTGAIVLANAPPIGTQSFATAFGASPITVAYCIVDQAGPNWETGRGTFNGTTGLTRTTVLASSNGGALVNFTVGTKDVFCTAPAAQLLPAGATTQVTYNNAGLPGASANFTYDSATNTVTFGNITGSALGMTIRPKIPTVTEIPGTLAIQASTPTRANTAGGGINIASGAGSGTGVGGTIDINSGAGSGTAAGGAVNLGSGSGSAGGEVNIYAGISSVNNGAAVNISGGAVLNGSRLGGAVNINSGGAFDPTSTTGDIFLKVTDGNSPGILKLTGGNASNLASAGGKCIITGGTGPLTGGGVEIYGGDAVVATGTGGGFTMTAGNGTNGGSFQMTGGIGGGSQSGAFFALDGGQGGVKGGGFAMSAGFGGAFAGGDLFMALGGGGTNDGIMEWQDSLGSAFMRFQTAAPGGAKQMAFYGVTPVIRQTTVIASAAQIVVGGAPVNTNDTFGGYTIGQIVTALKAYGLLT